MRLILWGTAALLAAASAWMGFRGPASRPPAAPAAPSPAADPGALLPRADRLLKDYRARPENLPEAIGLLRDAKEALKAGAERSPAPYVAACERLQEAERLRDAEADALWVEFERLRHLGDVRGASEVLRRLLRLVPETADKRNRRARSELARQIGPG